MGANLTQGNLYNDFCLDLLLNYQVGQKFKDSIKKSMSERTLVDFENSLVRKLLKQECVFDIERIKKLSEISLDYKVNLALMTKSYCLPIKYAENQKFYCVREKAKKLPTEYLQPSDLQDKNELSNYK